MGLRLLIKFNLEYLILIILLLAHGIRIRRLAIPLILFMKCVLKVHSHNQLPELFKEMLKKSIKDNIKTCK